ncbi:MAG: hypothetical protein ACTSU5_12240 [Promethearchaeota archaeon]
MMLSKRRFVHSGITYDFFWARENHQRLVTTTSYPEIRVLWKFLERVSRGMIPNLFNDRHLPRISQFRVKGLRRGVAPRIARELIRDGKILAQDKSGRIPRMVQEVFDNFKDAGISKKPGHTPVLKNILIKDESSIAVEVPVWRGGSRPITGHIDLLQGHRKRLVVLDYKPEGNFIRSLPQICFYGLLLERVIRTRQIGVGCVSFNKDAAWFYYPEIVHDITHELENNGLSSADIPWIEYLPRRATSA